MCVQVCDYVKSGAKETSRVNEQSDVCCSCDEQKNNTFGELAEVVEEGGGMVLFYEYVEWNVW